MCSRPVPSDEMEERNDVDLWSRVVKSLIVLGMACALFFVAKEWQESKAENLRRDTSTHARLLVSLHDTHTGVVEVRGLNNEIYFASPVACELLGYLPGELNGAPISKILPPGFRGIHETKVKESFRSVINNTRKHRVSTMRCFGFRKDGSTVEIVVRVFVSPNGIFALINSFDEMAYLDMKGGLSDPQPTKPVNAR